MKDPQIVKLDSMPMPFNAKRMNYGRFRVLVAA